MGFQSDLLLNDVQFFNCLTMYCMLISDSLAQSALIPPVSCGLYPPVAASKPPHPQIQP